MSAPIPKSEFILLFRGRPWDKGLSPEEIQQVMGQVMAWFDGLKTKGKVRTGQPLGEEGRTVSGKKGRMVADGPFAESKEAIGGYLILQVNEIDEAVAIAKSYPCLDYGSTVEVRPVLEECPIAQRQRERLADATV